MVRRGKIGGFGFGVRRSGNRAGSVYYLMKRFDCIEMEFRYYFQADLADQLKLKLQYSWQQKQLDSDRYKYKTTAIPASLAEDSCFATK